MHKALRRFPPAVAVLFCALFATAVPSPGCTGIQLEGTDGTVAVGRTMEWGAFDLESRIVVVPRGETFRSTTPEGENGIRWTGEYGFLGLDMLGRVYADGMNETGLVAEMFYHTGFADYGDYDPAQADISLAPGDVLPYILSTCSTLDEVRRAMEKIDVVPVVEPALDKPTPLHIKVTVPEGDALVIEFVDGETQIYDNPVGVITNNPTFPWHLTNLRNYGFISGTPFATKHWGDLEITPLAAGSGMLGLPGDFTSPSRFVRAVAFTQYARETRGGMDTVREFFRIMDSFDVGAHQGEGSGSGQKTPMPASTVWTVCHDTKAMTTYYHTIFNRRVRKIDFGQLDFAADEIVATPLDEKRAEDALDISGRLQ